MGTDEAIDYERWNTMLANHFFSREKDGRAVYLAVDDDELRRILDENELECSDPRASLAAAVQSQLGRGDARFARFLRLIETWREDYSAPPQLGLLALFVLAGSSMDRDTEQAVHANDYYSRLNPLLGREADERMPERFDEMHRLWNDLVTWLDDDLKGARGVSAVRTHHKNKHIGYPLSQCTLRARDRNRLPDFFRSAGLDPGAEISDGRLLILLRQWASREAASLTIAGTAAVLSDSDGMAAAVLSVVQQELSAWDGLFRDSEGRRRGDIVLAVQMRGRKVRDLRLLARCPEGFPDSAIWKDSHSQSVELTSQGNGWYDELPLGDSAKLLRAGRSLRFDRFALSFEPALVLVLAEDFDAYGWIPVRRPTVLRQHLVIARNDVAPQVSAFLRNFVDEPLKSEQLKAVGLPEWTAFHGVVLRTAPDTHPPAGLEVLVPRLETATSMEGGLKLGRDLYLTGGEPDLYVTTEDEKPCEIVVNGHLAASSQGSAKVRLSETALDEGKQTIEAGGRTLRLTNVRTYGDIVPSFAGGLTHQFESHGRFIPKTLVARESDSGAAAGVEVCGAHVRGARSELPIEVVQPTILRTGYSRYVVLGEYRGQVLTLGAPPKPKWLGDLGDDIPFQFFECEVPFAPQLVIATGLGGKKVWGFGSLPPQEATWTDPDADVAQWIQAIGAAAQTDPTINQSAAKIWPAYVKAASSAAQEIK